MSGYSERHIATLPWRLSHGGHVHMKTQKGQDDNEQGIKEDRGGDSTLTGDVRGGWPGGGAICPASS